jgi:hypothetical protein
MPVLFPAINPVDQKLSLGGFAITTAQDFTGTIVRRRWGQLSFGLRFDVDFGIIKDDLASNIWTAYNNSSGGFQPILLPLKLFSGIDADLLAVIPTHIQWEIKGVPNIKTALPGYSSASISFLGDLR